MIEQGFPRAEATNNTIPWAVPTLPLRNRDGAGGRVICETKRIRSHYVLLDVRQASRTL